MKINRVWSVSGALAIGIASALPAAAAEQQQPFICRTQESGLGQPLIDNQDGVGHPVLDAATGKVAGYSRLCHIAPRTEYFYFNGSAFKPFDPATGYAQPPADLKTIPYDGAPAPFVIRVEGGVINRFMYTVAMLAPRPPSAEAPGTGKSTSLAWNGKLIYWLRGGVGIGHQQGLAMWFNGQLGSSERALMPHLLGRGYAVVTSSGNETGVHYNMRLAEETARMTKAYFVSAYGQPSYTLGIGGSGGAVQQYLFAQNAPGLLDGGIPIYSYPDMVTQTIPVSDCPLLGQYFADAVARDPQSPWAKWSNQTLVEGMNASDTARNALTGGTGSTECINGWKFAMPTVINPKYRDPRFDKGAKAYGYAPGTLDAVKWTHWNDLADIYGTDSQGYAPIPVDNVGVQYGLAALANGKLAPDEFLRINACVGSWKEQPEFVQWDDKGDPYDSRNMRRSATCREPDGAPAPRRAGSIDAMRKAYTSGHVFTGARLGIPVIDLRPYLEPELNMHNARQSFAVRARLRQANPAELKNQVVWFTQTDPDLVKAVLKGVDVMDRYLTAKAPPPEFADTCFGAQGAVLASGPGVWDGILDGKAPGACTRAYPVHGSPRMVAGDGIRGDLFKCALKPVSAALADGTYGAVTFSAQQQAWLARIFPQGVCDYSQGDAGRPPGW
ncbi:hypothetical protein GJ700_30490 [Duganella sp. FT92W]|uniref:DUF6351 domain-containing protein n=1 Tax=Pseudoduganella rivuli TaxID=2666085 RepID=A0A7X2LXC0_9BURK|nr:DUF6351 family protein [Pseudoduganella rivuli]MRV76052.1 hypothetical protein [Pseudoduganella rivuli]